MFHNGNSISIMQIGNGFLVMSPVREPKTPMAFGIPEAQYIGMFDKILKRKDPVLSEIEDQKEMEERQANEILQSAMPAITPDNSIVFCRTIDEVFEHIKTLI